jgi:hypothetical protein
MFRFDENLACQCKPDELRRADFTRTQRPSGLDGREPEKIQAHRDQAMQRLIVAR